MARSSLAARPWSSLRHARRLALHAGRPRRARDPARLQLSRRPPSSSRPFLASSARSPAHRPLRPAWTQSSCCAQTPWASRLLERPCVSPAVELTGARTPAARSASRIRGRPRLFPNSGGRAPPSSGALACSPDVPLLRSCPAVPVPRRRQGHAPTVPPADRRLLKPRRRLPRHVPASAAVRRSMLRLRNLSSASCSRSCSPPSDGPRVLLAVATLYVAMSIPAYRVFLHLRRARRRLRRSVR